MRRLWRLRLRPSIAQDVGPCLAGQVCDIPYLVSIGKIKERVFPLYDLPFTNLALGGPMQLPAGDLRFGVNIDNRHYQDPGNVNAGFQTAEPVQNIMTTRCKHRHRGRGLDLRERHTGRSPDARALVRYAGDQP